MQNPHSNDACTEVAPAGHPPLKKTSGNVAATPEVPVDLHPPWGGGQPPPPYPREQGGTGSAGARHCKAIRRYIQGETNPVILLIVENRLFPGGTCPTEIFIRTFAAPARPCRLSP